MSRKITLSKGNSFLRINSVYDSLKSAEKRVADYILQNPRLVVDMTINELAEQSNSSYATINRFCKKLDYAGFKELRSSIVYYLTHNKGVDEMIKELDIPQNASVEELCENVYTLAYKVLDESLAFMDIDVVEAVVDAMLSARKICFVGSGASGICASYAYLQCLRIGLPCQYEPDTTIYRMATSLLEKGDLLFAISSSGRTGDIVEAARIAKKNGVTVVSLSDFAISPLAKVADFNLYTTPRNGSSFLNIDMPLIVGQITIVDILYACLCVKNPEHSSSAYGKTRASIDAEKIK